MVLDEFLKHLQLEKRYSPHTIRAYQVDLLQFQEFLKEAYNSTLIKADHVMSRSWLVQMLEYGISPRTVHRKITALKTFYKFLLKEEKLQIDPTLKIVLPKMTKKLPHFVEQEQMNVLLDELTF